MKQHYARFFLCFCLSCCCLSAPLRVFGQESKIFTAKDFDLTGPVKSCLVLTDYGKEEFEFNRNGLLTKSITRYNEKDYSITYYKYKDGHLVERRDEVYRDGKFDNNSSIAHFFKQDSLPSRRITEQIVTYNKEFLDSYEYYFNEEDQLIRIISSSNEGTDETQVEYSINKGEATTSYFLNEILLKTVRESTKALKNGSEERILLTKEFINGSPDKATEQTFNPAGNLISEVEFNYSQEEKSFIPVKSTTYEYGDNNRLSKVIIKADGQERTNNYVFQSDAKGNWIKKIVTPNNAYTTRKIEYFPEESADPNGG